MKFKKNSKRLQLEQVDLAKFKKVANNSSEIGNFFKVLGHSNRIKVLCRLCVGSCTVTELKNFLNMQQTTISQILTRLRLEGLVIFKRDGVKSIYSVSDKRVKEVMDVLIDIITETENIQNSKGAGKGSR